MSSSSKRNLAFCVAAALALPASAMAASFGYIADPIPAKYASNIFSATNTALTPSQTLRYTTHVTDNIVGRTTGFGVRLTLLGGANFNGTAPAVTFNATNVLGFTPGAPAVGAGPLGNVATYPMQATATANILVGDFLTIAPFTISGASALANGGTVNLRIEIFDSNTNAVLSDLTRTVKLIEAIEGVDVIFTPSAGNINKRIDVTSCATQTPPAGAKTQFSPGGDVGGSCGAGGNSYFNAGQVMTRISTDDSPSEYFVSARGFAGANVQGPANQFAFADGDQITYTVSGVDFAAFDTGAAATNRVFLSLNNNCSTRDLAMTVNTARTEATGTFVVSNTGNFLDYFWTPVFFGAYNVCFTADPARLSEIAAQPIKLSVATKFNDGNVRNPAPSIEDMLPLRYNGTVMSFQNVNPGSNPRAQSFLRFSNNGPITCPVTLTGRDDNGVAGTTAVTFDLASGKSATFNSEDLENGSSKGTGAFGDGAGRWWVTATGACGGLVGSALNRNLEDGTVTNLTPQNHGSNL